MYVYLGALSLRSRGKNWKEKLRKEIENYFAVRRYMYIPISDTRKKCFAGIREGWRSFI